MGSDNIARVALACGLVFMLAGCTASTQPAERPNVSDNSTKSSVPGELRGQGTVLQERPAEPKLCLGIVTASDPPLCAGPAIEGWNWNSVAGSKTVGTVTYGDYQLEGTWDGKTFTLGKHLHGRSDSMSMSRGHAIHVAIRQIEALAHRNS